MGIYVYGEYSGTLPIQTHLGQKKVSLLAVGKPDFRGCNAQIPVSNLDHKRTHSYIVYRRGRLHIVSASSKKGAEAGTTHGLPRLYTMHT